MGAGGAYLEKLHLQQVSCASHQMMDLLPDDLVGMEPEQDNQARLLRLRDEDKRLASLYAAALTAQAATWFVPEPLTQAGSLLVGKVGTNLLSKRGHKVRSIVKNADGLDEAFADQQIQIFPDLDIPGQGRLDLFVRFPLPPKNVLAIALRSQGQAEVRYSEEEECFFVRRNSSARWKQWNPDHIEKLGVQGFWLRQNRSELFGTSRSDRNRPLVKILVVTGKTKLAVHPDHLYSQVGEEKVLLIRRQSTIYVMHEDQLIGFLKAYRVPGQQ